MWRAYGGVVLTQTVSWPQVLQQTDRETQEEPSAPSRSFQSADGEERV